MSHWICLGLAFIICAEPRFNINVIVQGSEMYLRKVQIKVPRTNCLFVWNRSQITTETKVNCHVRSESQRVNIVSQMESIKHSTLFFFSDSKLVKCVHLEACVCEASTLRVWRFFHISINNWSIVGCLQLSGLAGIDRQVFVSSISPENGRFDWLVEASVTRWKF